MLQQRQSISGTAQPLFPDSSSPPPPGDVINFDQILAKCGDFGRYQFMLLTLFGLINVLVSMHYFTQTIISFVPDHWCYHDQLTNKSFKEINAIYEKFEPPSCTKLEAIDEEANNTSLSKERCTKWIYRSDYGYVSMNMDFNWVCDQAFKSSVGQSLFFVGSMVGTLFYGYLSDKIGRVPALVISNFSGFLGDFLTIFSVEVWVFATCRFISGLAADTNSYIMYIIVLEYIRPKMRTLGLNLMIGIFYCMGLVLSPWLAVLTGYWKYFLYSTSLPILLVVGFYIIVQESAQWLVTCNNIDGAIRRLKVVAAINRRMVSENDFQNFRKYCEVQQTKRQTEKRSNLFDMFKTPRIRKTTIILFFKSMVITACYDAISRNVEGLGVSPFIAFTVSSLAVLPASLVLICIQDRIGRKGSAVVSMFFSAIITFIIGIIFVFETERNPILLLVLTFVARFGVAVSYESGSQYATELIPTCVRGQGVAAVHVAGFGVSFLVPYLLYLGNFYKSAPLFIISVLFFAGSFSCLLLPETTNRSLPQTIEDGEEFGKGEKICSFPCFEKREQNLEK